MIARLGPRRSWRKHADAWRTRLGTPQFQLTSWRLVAVEFNVMGFVSERVRAAGVIGEYHHRRKADGVGRCSWSTKYPVVPVAAVHRRRGRSSTSRSGEAVVRVLETANGRKSSRKMLQPVVDPVRTGVLFESRLLKLLPMELTGVKLWIQTELTRRFVSGARSGVRVQCGDSTRGEKSSRTSSTVRAVWRRS